MNRDLQSLNASHTLPQLDGADLATQDERLDPIARRHRDNLIEHLQCEWPGCGERFSRRADLSSHLRSHAYPDTYWHCPQPGCTFSCVQGSARTRHIQNVHAEIQ